MAPKIYLARHGKTQANREDRFAGRSDEPLCEEGVSQFQGLAEKCGSRGFTAVYAGPLPRTIQSAQIIAGTCGLTVHTVAGLIDINLPHWDTLTKDEIRQRFGNEYPTWLATPEKFHVPGCENLAAVQKRAVAEVEKILAKEEGVILLVTHLIVARCLLLHYNGQPISLFREIKVENSEVVRLV